MSKRHYELVLLVHPEYSEQLPAMQQRYQELIASHGGLIHRQEDWGRRSLAYPIQNQYKAHYLLYNIELSVEGLQALETAFRYNDAVLRSLTVSETEAIKEPSAMLKQREPRKDSRISAGGNSASNGSMDVR